MTGEWGTEEFVVLVNDAAQTLADLVEKEQLSLRERQGRGGGGDGEGEIEELLMPIRRWHSSYQVLVIRLNPCA